MTAPSPWNVLETWNFDPIVTLTLTIGAALYMSGAWRSVRGPTRARARWPLRRTVAFVAGLGAIALALESGLDVYDDQLLSIHMLQHLVLVLVAPPLLLAGAPVTLMLRALPPSERRRLARILRGRSVMALTRPAVGLIVLGVTMLATHLTPLYALALSDNLVHVGEHVLYLFAGLLFWAVLIAPGPMVRRVDGLGQVVYLLLGMPLMSVVGVLLETGISPRYHEYVVAARRLGISAMADQRFAGTIMWLAGTAAMGAVALAVAWRSMVAEERVRTKREIYADRHGDSPLGSDAVARGSR